MRKIYHSEEDIKAEVEKKLGKKVNEVIWDILKEDVETLNYAVKDLLKVVQMESKQLVFIKGEIVMQNIKDIEKTLKDGEESGKI
jgi:hypothetical protein